MAELSGPPFCISMLKVLKTQILCHSLDFSVICMIQYIVLRLFKFPQIKEEEPKFLEGTNSAERLSYLIPTFVFQF